MLCRFKKDWKYFLKTQKAAGQKRIVAAGSAARQLRPEASECEQEPLGRTRTIISKGSRKIKICVDSGSMSPRAEIAFFSAGSIYWHRPKKQHPPEDSLQATVLAEMPLATFGEALRTRAASGTDVNRATVRLDSASISPRESCGDGGHGQR